MMKRKLTERAAALLLALSLGLSMTACSGTAGSKTAASTEQTSESIAAESSTQAAPEETAETGQAAEDKTVRGAAWRDSDLVGSVKAADEIRLQDDFAASANRDWIAGAVIPDGESEVSAFTQRQDELDAQLKSLLTDTTLTGHEAQLVQSLYSVVTDWETRNALGVEPARPCLEAIDSIDSLDAMTAFLKGENNPLMLGIFSFGAAADFDEPTRYTVYIEPTGLCLGDSEEYGGDRTQLGELYYTGCHDTCVYMLSRFGYTSEEAEAVMDGNIAFEGLCAEHELPRDAQFEADYYTLVNNTYDRAGLEELSGAFPLPGILDAYGYGISERFCVTEPDWLRVMADIYTEDNLDIMKDYLKIRLCQSVCYMLDREAYDRCTEISNSINGIEGTKDDATDAYETVAAMLDGPMNKLYIQQFCSEKTRSDITTIIHEVINYYRVMLEGEDWLSEETRQKAIEKLDSLKIRAAYPDQLDDYSALSIKAAADGGTYLDASYAIMDYSLSENLKLVNSEVDPEKWDFSVTQVNAAYNPQDNSINIYNGILGGVFYDENGSREANLAGIGTVIGHEISHAFDTHGSQFDKDGVLANWWTDADRAAFNERAAKLISYYDGIVLYDPEESYSGTQVQGEAIADMGGMKCMLAIAANEKDFDYDAFFRHYASVWRAQCSRNTELQLIKLDPHPLDYLRINVTLQQFDEFCETYDIKPDDGMYLAPEERITVW